MISNEPDDDADEDDEETWPPARVGTIIAHDRLAACPGAPDDLTWFLGSSLALALRPFGTESAAKGCRGGTP